MEREWDKSILPRIEDYIRIPCKSPMFEPEWEKTGHLERAVGLIEAWCKEQAIPGLAIEIVRLPGRSPLLFMELAATDGSSGDTVMMYGHYDKQPEMSGWSEGLGPWLPVRRGDKLYGRGGADDGYAAFASLAALRKALPLLQGVRLEAVRSTLRPMPRDGFTCIGALTHMTGYYVAATHSGVTLAPYLGRALADEIVRDLPHDALAPFSPDRFFLEQTATSASAELVGVKPVEGPA